MQGGERIAVNKQGVDGGWNKATHEASLKAEFSTNFSGKAERKWTRGVEAAHVHWFRSHSWKHKKVTLRVGWRLNSPSKFTQIRFGE